MKTTGTAIEDDDRVRKIATLCYRDCDEAVAIIEYLEAGNSHDAEAAFLDGHGHLPLLIRKAMMQRLLMSIMRMYDKRHIDRETLPRAFELLNNPIVYRAVCAQGIGLRLDAAIARWKVMQIDPVLTKMRAVRDYELAHTIPSKAGEARPRTMDFFCIARQTIALIEELAAGSGVVSVSFEHARGIWAQRAEAYWARLIAARVTPTG